MHLAQQVASARGHPVGGGVGCPDQRRRDGGLGVVQPVGGLAKQAARQRIDAHQLAPERHQVEVGLQDLVFAPRAFQLARGEHLPDFLAPAAPARAQPQLVVDQAGELHGDGGGAACVLVPQPAPGGRRGGRPVDAGVFVEAPVFAQQQGLAQGDRHVFQTHPFALAPLRVAAQALQQFAMAVEHAGLRAGLTGAHRLEAGQRGEGTAAGQRQGRAQHGRLPAAPWPQGAASTRMRALGASPNTSGAYMASTRVGGTAKSPTLFRRRVYCTCSAPLGTWR